MMALSRHLIRGPIALTVALAAALFASGCATGGGSAGVDQQQVNRIVGQVLNSQSHISNGEKIQALADLDTFLSTTSHRSDRVAGALEQLAGLYLQIELQTWDKAYRRWQANGRPGAMPRVDHSRSVRLYNKWLADYADKPARVRIYYQLARIYDDVEDYPAATRYLKKLLATPPESPQHKEARYRLGELAFDDGRFYQAADWYEQVLDSKAAPSLKDLAGYKRAWAYYLAPDDTKAVAAAVDFIDSRRVKRNGRYVLDSKQIAELDWERIREVMAIAANALQRQGGVKALEKQIPKDRDYGHMIYRKLAEVWASLGFTDTAIATYRSFVDSHPLSPHSPAFLGYLVYTYTAAHQLEKAVAVREELINNYGSDSVWWATQSAATIRVTEPAIRQTMHRLARYHHSLAQKSKKRSDYENAARWYRRYLAAYPDAKDSGKTRFLLGEGLFESGSYAEAAEAYLASAYDSPPHGKAAEAAYAAVFTLERQLAGIDRDDPAHLKVLTALDQAMLKWIRRYPHDPRLPSAFERVSGLLFDAEAYNMLYDLNDTIIREGPKNREVHILAWRALGEAALETGRADQAEKALAQALTYVQDDPEQSAEIKRLMAAAAVSMVSAPTTTTDQAAAALMRASTLLDKSDPLAESVRVDAGLTMFKGGDYAGGLEILAAFLADYPQSSHRDRVAQTVFSAGERAMLDGDPAQALMVWDRYTEWFGGEWPDRDRRLLKLTGRARMEAGDLAAADASFSQLVASYDGDAPEEEIDRLAGIRFKRAAAMIEAGNPEGLTLFARIAEELPGSRLAPAALDGILAATSGGPLADPARALSAAQQLMGFYPQSDQAQEAKGRLVALYLAAGKTGDAAAELVAQAAETDDDAAIGMLLRAADLYEQAGATDRAMGALITLRDRFTAGSDRWVAAHVDSVHLEVAGHRTLPGREADPALHEEVDDQLLSVFTPLAEADQLGARGRSIAGRIWLRRAEAARAEFEAIKLVPPLKENLSAKKKALKTALRLFQKAEDFRSLPTTVSATHQKGEMFELFGNGILNSPVPAKLNAAQAEIYTKGLKKKAGPYLKRAAKAYAANLKRIRDGVSAPGLHDSLLALGRLNPTWYDRPEIGAVLIHVP